jgi:hypothetical protein
MSTSGFSHDDVMMPRYRVALAPAVFQPRFRLHADEYTSSTMWGEVLDFSID